MSMLIMVMVKLKLLYYVIIVVTCVENVIVYCIITNVPITNVSDNDLHFYSDIQRRTY